MGRPRIAFFGNVGNSHLGVVSALRDAGEVEADLFVDVRDPLPSKPESDRPELAGNYPPWIRAGSWVTPRTLLVPWRAPVTRELAAYDLIVASHNAPVFAQFAGRPYCVLATGADVTVRPFPITFRNRRGALPAQVGHALVSLWQRRAIRHADVVWMQPFAPFAEAARRLRLDSARLSNAYFPLAIDTSVFRADVSRSPAPEPLRSALSDAELVVFHPTRLVFDDSPAMRRSGQWKGSATLFEGWAEFMRRRPDSTARLVLPDWTGSEGVEHAKLLVRDLGLTESVVWAVPPRPDGFRRSELVEIYAAADVVVDEFGVGWFGYVSLEGMSCGRPVISNVDEAVIDRLYEEHPWQVARTPAEVAERLAALHDEPAMRTALGPRSRKFVESNHSLDAVRPKYIAAVMDALARTRP